MPLVSRVAKLERELDGLRRSTARSEEVDLLRSEAQRSFDEVELALMELKSHITGIDQDIRALARQVNTVIRI